MTFVGPNINATAHIAGLVVGFLIGLSIFHPKRIISWRKPKLKVVDKDKDCREVSVADVPTVFL